MLTAARQRLDWVLDRFPRVYVSFSGGKDSTALLHIAAERARVRGRQIGCLFIDLEAQYQLTIDHVADCFAQYADCIEPFWVALPLNLRNAVSVFEPQWMCWDPARRTDWVREPHRCSITDESFFPFFRRGMEFEELVPAFGKWYSQGQPTASLIGIRVDESLHRWRTLCAGRKQSLEDKPWTTWTGGVTYNAYPIYDWRVDDIWTYHSRTGASYNRLYDRMHQAGLTLAQMRICQPYGDDQRKGLWLFHLIEPETWGRVVARVNGANGGALYARESGNVLGRIKISKPEGHTWESFAGLLLDTMPTKTAEHYRNKIAVFLRWWELRGYSGGIPDEQPASAEAARDVPSWRRICKALLRNDYWCKGMSFSQHKSHAYEKYLKVMKKRRKHWGYP